MNRKVLTGVAILIAALFFILLRGGGGNVILVAQADKDSYAAGEDITLTLTLTNAGEESVCLSQAATGNVRLSVTRDGEPVASRTAPARYLTSLAEIIKGQLVPVPAGDSITVSLTSSYDPGLGVAALRETELDGTAGIVTFYDVSSPGAYEVELRYGYPGEASAECRDVFTGPTDPATVPFTVTQ